MKKSQIKTANCTIDHNQLCKGIYAVRTGILSRAAFSSSAVAFSIDGAFQHLAYLPVKHPWLYKPPD